MSNIYVNCCPELWRELHLRALNVTLGPNNNRRIINTERVFITNWSRRIPTKGCKCSDFWHNWYKTNPINFRDYFAWTVNAHNAVNKKLGKELWTVERARQFWEMNK